MGGFLGYLFVYKLIVVNRMHMEVHNQQDEKLFLAVTKLSVLASMSLCSAVMVAIALSVVPYIPFSADEVVREFHTMFVVTIFTAADVMTNFISILFTFHSSHAY